MSTSPWPDRRITPREPTPHVGDTVELGTTRYRIAAFHQTDDGMLAKLTPTGGATFVMAHELRWDGAVWRQQGPTESELRVMDGNR